VLEALSVELVSTESTNRFLTGMIGERAISGEFIRLAQDDVRKMVEISNQGISDDEEKTMLPNANPGIGWRCLGFFERDRNFFLRAMETNIGIVSLTPPASLSLTNESDKLETQARRGFYLMSSLFLPSLSHTSLRDAYVRASLRTSFTAVAIERWRIAHNGMTPDSLKNLVPNFFTAVPLDPYDGKPLRFKKTAKGYVVYSIGPNRQDDGGKERPSRSTHIPAAERNQFDITFSVER
jgi:hypothetical protein